MNGKPDMLERVGTALSRADLAPDETRIKPVDLVAALAYIQLNPDNREHGAQDIETIDPRTALASTLIRLKYGGDNALGDRAVHMLVQWIVHQRAYRAWKIRANGVLPRFAQHGLAEWLFPVCPECKGREMVGLEQGEIVERRLRCNPCRGAGFVRRAIHKPDGRKAELVCQCGNCGGRGWRTLRKIRDGKPKLCAACGATGQRRMDQVQRAMAIDLPVEIYRKHWERRFDWLAAAFDRIDALARRCLQNQMREGITRN